MALRKYTMQLSRYRGDPLPCDFCHQPVPPALYEKHCLDHHSLNPKRTCVWCKGAQSWQRGERSTHAHHLLECWRRFRERYSNLLCPARDPFGRSLEGLHVDEIQLWERPPLHRTYGSDSMNLAIQILQRFLDDTTLEWYHVMVSRVALPSFIEAMDADGGVTRTLPFWCWCDGGSRPELDHRQHRHMIVLSPRRHFKRNVWKYVGVPDRSHSKSINSKRLKVITHPMHLANALGYVSKRKSKCMFSFKTEGPVEKMCHFYINKPLPTQYLFDLSTLWPEGLEQLLHQKFLNTSPHTLIRIDGIVRKRRHWKVPVRKLPDPGIVVKVMALTAGQSCYLGARKIRLPSNKPRKIRFFGDVSEDEWFHPKPAKQLRLNDIYSDSPWHIQLRDEVDQLRAEHADCIAELERLRTENQRLRDELDRASERCSSPEPPSRSPPLVDGK